jgi:hypothetical protein
LVNEAQELSIVKGKYGNTTATRRYQVSECNRIILDPDAESILAFSINGRPGIVGDKYWKAVTRQNIGTRNSSFVGGPFFAMSTLAGASAIEPTAVPLDQEEKDEHDRCCHAYEIHPCGTWFRCCVEATVKLRYLPAKCLTDHLLITNYSAIKTIVEGLIKKDNSDFGAYQALKNDGFQTLDVEMRHRKGGAAGKMRKGSWATTRFSQGMR